MTGSEPASRCANCERLATRSGARWLIDKARLGLDYGNWNFRADVRDSAIGNGRRIGNVGLE
jgi:hypothetical protein